MSNTSLHKSQQMFRGKPMVRMHTMIKATGPVCNLNCGYCYYLSKEQLLSTDSHWRISDETLERFIKQYIEQQNARTVVFSWQGGEPSLLGLDFYKKVVELQKKYAPSYVRCENDLQTNGTLLDDKWCEFLREHDFLVGLSIDGPKHLHDAYRTYKGGKGSFDRVLESAKLLNKHQVKFATLTVVNDINAGHPQEVYQFLRDEIRSTQMQFIPIVESRDFQTTAPQHWDSGKLPDENSQRVNPKHPDSFLAEWCVEPTDYGNFLIKIFDEWYKNDFGKIYIPFFDSAVEQWMGRPSPLCIFSPICGKGLAMEHNGDIYACDHYVYPEYKLGNINKTPLIDMALAQEQERFGYSKDFMLPMKCRECRYLFACSGECPKNRLLKTSSGESGLNYLCKGLYKYFSHIDPSIRKIVNRLGYEVADDVPPLSENIKEKEVLK
ncbi:MAG: anaerobic sulfatase maturase [Tannerella sp.]|nr:anaerobic sulfatase maturase [Tannerella sp.]